MDPSTTLLVGRQAELTVIDDLLARRTGVLVVRGEAGIGKSALLAHAAATDQARVLRVTGVESEADLPFAALHRLLRPVLHHAESLQPQQAGALRGALGLGRPAQGDRYLVGLATLSLLVDLSAEGPVLCLIDDAHWLDGESADALLFATRRLHTEPVMVLLAARDPFPPTDLPELRPATLEPDAARQLLARRAPDLPPAVRDQLVAEAQGNPLALVELPRMLTPEQRAGAPLFLSAGSATPVTDRVLGGFRDRIAALPEATRSCLLVAALDHRDLDHRALDHRDLAGGLARDTLERDGLDHRALTRDGLDRAGLERDGLDALARAAGRLGASLDDLAPAEHAGLVRVTTAGVAFHHPLVRRAVLLACDIAARMAAHRALAQAADDDRRAWHLAALTPHPDEEVAALLVELAVRARQRGGQTAVSAAYARAAQLSADPALAAGRWTAAAAAAVEAGLWRRAADLADQAVHLTATTTVPGSVTAELAAVRAKLAVEADRPLQAVRLLHQGAEASTDLPTRLSLLGLAGYYTWASATHPDQPVLARRTEELTPAGEGLPAVVRSINTAFRLILEGRPVDTHAHLTPGPADHVPPELRFLIAFQSLHRADRTGMLADAADLVAGCRAQGRLGRMPQALTLLAIAQLLDGRHPAARATAAEGIALAADLGQPYWRGYLAGVQAWLSALAGDDHQVAELAEQAVHAADHRNWMPGACWAQCARVMLDLGQGRHDAVLARLDEAMTGPTRHAFIWRYLWPDHIEAAIRVGQTRRAGERLTAYTQWAEATGRATPLAVLHRVRALLATENTAPALFERALTLHADEPQPFDEARTRLLYGEWLRRHKSRAEARTHLHAALETFDRLAATPWAARAAAELRAAGYALPDRPRPAGPLAVLTPQELQVVRLAVTGASNREIGAHLFLSPRTVASHLYKAFPKLGVTSRAELARLIDRLEPQSTSSGPGPRQTELRHPPKQIPQGLLAGARTPGQLGVQAQ